MDKALASMSFAQFAAAVRPSGGINRYTMPGTDIDVHTWSVYMNGPLAEQLPANAREHEFRDVMVNALTEKLGLDSGSFRDTLKVAEIVATRSAYLAAVSELLRDRTTTLSPEAMEECLLLADKSRAMTHPWIVSEIEKQMALSKGLAPVLARASEVVGREVTDRAPREVGMGRVVAADLNFTVQHTTDGEIVTHENRRLSKVPVVGENITVSYYRGGGQVVDSLDKMQVSPPFIDKKSMDLAVVVVDGKGKEQMVLFNSMVGFHEFVQVHGLDEQMMAQAMDARTATPKPAAKAPPMRVAQGVPYIEEESGCLGIDFTENGVPHGVLFGSMAAMEGCAKEFGITPPMLEAARQLTPLMSMEQAVEDMQEITQKLHQLGYRGVPKDAALLAEDKQRNTFIGKVVAEAGVLVAQDVGRGEAVTHDLRKLDHVVGEGERMTVKYNNGRGSVLEIERGGQSMER